MAFEPGVSLTWGAQLAHAERVFAAAGTPAPRNEAIELLGSLLGAPTALLRAQPAGAMSQRDAERFSGWVSRRAKGEEIPHITGRLLFMGLELSVERDSPLPALGTQRLVEIALQLARSRSSGDLLAANIGAGCGAVALTLASLEPRFSRIYAVEASETGIGTATANGARYLLNLIVSWRAGDGLDSVPEPVDVMVFGQLDQRSTSMTRLLELASAKVRPGGALICAVADEWSVAASELLACALPGASIWGDSQSGEPAIIVAQLPNTPVAEPSGAPAQEQ